MTAPKLAILIGRSHRTLGETIHKLDHAMVEKHITSEQFRIAWGELKQAQIAVRCAAYALELEIERENR